MAGNELVTEGFQPGQVGSSAMPHKMNTRSAERINGFQVLLRGYAGMAGELAGDQWNEGDVSCSVVRRVALPDACYALDGMLETTLTVLDEFGAFPAVIERELERYLPFLATTKVLMAAVRAGVGREAAHEAIKDNAVAVALELREKGTDRNDLLDRLAADSRLGPVRGAARRRARRPDHLHRRRARPGRRRRRRGRGRLCAASPPPPTTSRRRSCSRAMAEDEELLAGPRLPRWLVPVGRSARRCARPRARRLEPRRRGPTRPRPPRPAGRPPSRHRRPARPPRWRTRRSSRRGAPPSPDCSDRTSPGVRPVGARPGVGRRHRRPGRLVRRPGNLVVVTAGELEWSSAVRAPGPGGLRLAPDPVAAPDLELRPGPVGHDGDRAGDAGPAGRRVAGLAAPDRRRRGARRLAVRVRSGGRLGGAPQRAGCRSRRCSTASACTRSPPIRPGTACSCSSTTAGCAS